MKIQFQVGTLLLSLVISGCSLSDGNEAGPGVSSNATPAVANAVGDSSSPDLEKTNPENTSEITGSWKHVSTAQSPEGRREPVDISTNTWTFNNDGSGAYKQTVKGMSAAAGATPFTWKLNGNDLEIVSQKGGPTIIYTIVKQSKDEMTWRNNVLGDYYIVQKQ
jgi:hypothetical protein